MNNGIGSEYFRVEDLDEVEDHEAIKEIKDQIYWTKDLDDLEFIADYHFKDYAQSLAEDIGAIENAYDWPASHIDWEEAADDLQQDYTRVEVEGQTYWTRG